MGRPHTTTSLPGLTRQSIVSEKESCEVDGCAGPGYAKASPGTPVSGRRSFSEDGKPAHDASRFPDAVQRAAVHRRAGIVTKAGVWYGPGSAKHHAAKERRAASRPGHGNATAR